MDSRPRRTIHEPGSQSIQAAIHAPFLRLREVLSGRTVRWSGQAGVPAQPEARLPGAGTVTRQHHLWFAGALWTVIGAALLVTGLRLWFGPAAEGGAQHAAIGLAAVALGLVKGQWVLGRTAGRVIERVPDQSTDSVARSLYTMFGPRMLALIAVMMALGMLLRGGGFSEAVRGFVCLVIGPALLWSSRRYWRASFRPGAEGGR